MARWIFVVAIAYFSLRYLPPLSERNVLVMVETQGLYIDSLSNITGLKAAFQVRKSFDEYVLGDKKREEIEKRKKFNLIMVFEHNVKGQFPFEKFELDLKSHAFVKSLEILPFTSRPLKAKAINLYISLMSHLSKNFPSVFGGSLKEAIFDGDNIITAQDNKLLSDCKKINEKDDRPFIMVNINRDNRENEDNWEYGKNVIMNIFPRIESRIYIAGEPESDYWDRLAIVRYTSERKFCEMVLSEDYRKLRPLKTTGLDDAYTSSTIAVLAYQKDLVK